jgi:hypothetical protein
MAYLEAQLDPIQQKAASSSPPRQSRAMQRYRVSIGHEERDEEDVAVQELISPIHRVRKTW